MPHLREPMRRLSKSDPCHTVTLMFCSQMGKSEVANNFLLYKIEYDPGPVMMVQPTKKTAEKYSTQRLGPMIDNCPELKSKVGKTSRSRNTGDKMLEKKFPGGILFLVGSNSAAELASFPMSAVLIDEVDRTSGDVGGEGSAVDVAKKRTSAYPRSKILQTSTPTEKGRSRIEQEWESSTKHRRHVPCPECGVMQELELEQLKWPPGKPDLARYQCAHCDELIQEHEKNWMLPRGAWVAEEDDDADSGVDPGHVGYHINALYAPYGWGTGWGELAREYVKATGNSNLMRVFTNTRMGQPYEVAGDRPDWEKLYLRREDYRQGTVPARAFALTAGVDVHKDRLELEVVGWAPGLESWSVDYIVLQGDTSTDDSPVWDELDEVLDTEWPHELGGHLKISKLCIDCGYRSQRVYSWCARHHRSKVLAVKGSSTIDVDIKAAKPAKISRNGKPVRTGAWRMVVGVTTIKREIYGWLGLPLPEDDADNYPAGWCHFPEYGQEYFKQISAEKEIARPGKYGTKYGFVKVYDRNEALDCRVYARAAAAEHGIDRWDEKKWKQAEAQARGGKKRRPRRRSRDGGNGSNRNSRGRRKSRWMD